MEKVYRLVTTEQWSQIKATGVLPRYAVDQQSGFIHLSVWDTVIATANLYFPDESSMIGIEMYSTSLGEKLIFEPVPSRNNELFPHFYGETIAFEHFVRIALLNRTTGHGFRLTSFVKVQQPQSD